MCPRATDHRPRTNTTNYDCKIVSCLVVSTRVHANVSLPCSRIEGSRARSCAVDRVRLAAQMGLLQLADAATLAVPLSADSLHTNSSARHRLTDDPTPAQTDAQPVEHIS